MPTPIHVVAYEAFNAGIPDHLEASVAFALFLVSEREWANAQPAAPDDAAYRTFHESYLTNHEIWRYQQEARRLLAEFGTRIVDAKRIEFMESALHEYQNAASTGHRAFRNYGILEAIAAAALWTLLLILFSIILAWNGIDIFEYYRKALPAHSQVTLSALV